MFFNLRKFWLPGLKLCWSGNLLRVFLANKDLVKELNSSLYMERTTSFSVMYQRCRFMEINTISGSFWRY